MQNLNANIMMPNSLYYYVGYMIHAPRWDSSACIEIQIVLNMAGDNAKSTEAIATVYQ